MEFRIGNTNDLMQLQQLFVDTIKFVCKADYNHEQINAWVSGIENKKRWNEILTNQFVLISFEKEIITGFCTLENGNYLDLLYVSKDYQHQGIAFKLYKEIEKEAKRQSQRILTADVSITARSFFEKLGFKILKENKVSINGVELTNYKMAKNIN